MTGWTLRVGAVGMLALAIAATPARVRAQAAPGYGADRDGTDAALATVNGSAQASAEAPTAAAPASANDRMDAAGLFRPTPADAKLLAPAPRALGATERVVHAPAYRRSEGVPLMIVGGAMFLAGAIISDRAGDAIMVAGVVVAAVGLYEYLQ